MEGSKIEKGIPLPDKKTASQYPFSTMEIGDSFKTTNRAVSSSVSTANSTRKPKKFTYRKEKDGIRVWRIA